LFGEQEEDNFSMNETQTTDILQIYVEENNLLTAPYSEKEVQKTIFQIK
jgi:hypothetical protein